MKKLVFLATALSILFIQAASAASVRVYNDELMQCLLILEGEIVEGDADKLRKSVANLNSAEPFRLCLNSPGGSFLEGIKIAEFIGSWDYMGTAVAKGHKCESACAVAFLSGGVTAAGVSTVRPILHPMGRLGFHAPDLILPESSYTAAEVKLAYQVALQSVKKIVDLRTQSYRMSENLLLKFLDTLPPDMFYIQTVGDALDFDIGIYPVAPNPNIYEAFTNFCNATVGYASGVSVEQIKISEFNTEAITLKSETGFGEEALQPCELTINLQNIMRSGGYWHVFDDNKIYATFQREKEISNISTDVIKGLQELQNNANRIFGSKTDVSSVFCASNSNFAKIVNVNQFVNIRAGASLADRVVATANRGQRVQVVQPNSWWFKETRRGRQCSEICSRYHQTPTNSTLASQAKQCVDDKEIWTKVRVNGREGYVSVYFLEAQ